MFGKSSKTKGSFNRRLVYVSEEHDNDLLERYFTTLDRVEQEYGDVYQDGREYWYENIYGEEPKVRYDSLTDEVKQTGSTRLDTKYRHVSVREVTPENIRSIVGNPSLEYYEGDAYYQDHLRDYMNGADEPWYAEELLSVTDKDLEYLGHSKKDIKAARKAQKDGDLWPLFLLWKEAWDPRQTPAEVHPQLAALGVSKELYDPSVNPYRGNGRGSFNRKHGASGNKRR